MVILFKVPTITGGSDLVKIPLLGCHPNTGVGPFKSYLWLADKPLAEILTEYCRDFIPLFLNESRKVLTEFKWRNREQRFGLIVVRMCRHISQRTLASSGQRISTCLSQSTLFEIHLKTEVESPCNRS